MDIPAIFEKTFYYLSNEEKDFQDLFLERHAITNKEQLVAVAVGGGGGAARSKMTVRHWPVQNYIELIQRFQSECSFRFILIGGPEDRRITNRIIQICPDCLDATDLSLGDMASVLRRCNLFVGSDNSRNHIAVAMEVPGIKVFNSADSRLPTSSNNAHVASAATRKDISFMDVKFSKFIDFEYPVAVSVDEAWHHLRALSGYPDKKY
jgi:ADP-heptose:LPS heptosyltransferase